MDDKFFAAGCNMQVSSEVSAYRDELIRIRRELHKIPEPSFCEYRTSQFVQNYLNDLKPDRLDIMANTGVRAVFYAKNPKHTFAFRADMDALSIREENDVPYRSQNHGVMHACGHDGHMAMGLGFARYASEHRDALKNNIVCIFQPGEEGLGGADKMCRERALENPHVDEIYGLHIWPDVPKGKLGINEGPIMSRMAELNIHVTGASAHGSSPHKGNDALVAAASLISMIQTIVSRNINPFEQAAITIGKIQGGTARNIICGDVHLEGTIRTFSDDVYHGIMDHLKSIMRGIEDAFGVKCSNVSNMSYPPVINPHDLAQRARELLKEDAILMTPVMQSEDFSFFQRRVPGMFIMLGSGDETYNSPLHSNRFDFDEEILLYGVETFRRLSEYV